MATREGETPTQPSQPSRSRRRPRGGADTRKQRRRAVGYVLLAGAVVLMVNALVGEKGYLAGLRARRDYNAAMSDLIRLRVENQQLKEQARRLKDDPSAIEESARRELGLIRPGETLIIIKGAVKDAARKDSR